MLSVSSGCCEGGVSFLYLSAQLSRTLSTRAASVTAGDSPAAAPRLPVSPAAHRDPTPTGRKKSFKRLDHPVEFSSEFGMPWARPQVDPHACEAEAMDQYNVDDHHYEGSLFPASTLIPVTVICIIIFIVGVTGNTMTILIIQHFKDMKTTTNLYLSSMAVSDLIIFLCLPFDLYRLWKYVPWLFGEAVCRFYHYIFEGCTSATILHITALSIERYLAISFPLRSKVMVTRRRVQYIIFALWGFALVSAAPTLFLVGVEYDNETHPDFNTGQCKHTSYA
uniref:Motilin receptor n=2 Tax=Kryptolebias marmoratus TaxID=37003 RepID=A0A3Q3EWE1_KRYMA